MAPDSLRPILARALTTELRLHPRLAEQGCCASPAERERLFAALPALIPFPGKAPPRAVTAVLDWDHCIPIERLVLRLHLLDDERAFERAHAERTALIARRNLYPEFDLPDYEGLPAEETYVAELSPELLLLEMRLESTWRRDIDPRSAHAAVETVRRSHAFAEARAAAQAARPQRLEPQAMSWTPPCESGHPTWTIDVWWLTAFNGQSGRGWSFFVELDPVLGADRVVATREIAVRSG